MFQVASLLLLIICVLLDEGSVYWKASPLCFLSFLPRSLVLLPYSRSSAVLFTSYKNCVFTGVDFFIAISRIYQNVGIF